MSQQLNLLSLDGGGVRGLSSLYILQKLMEEINPTAPPKPCDYFDMIGGTSTGGIIAIMLGRLGMSVDECINAYVNLSATVFVKKHRFPVTLRGKIQERYDSSILEREIRRVVEKYEGSEDALFMTGQEHPCKVFVCATSQGVTTPELLTSYRRPQGDTMLYRTAKIWEAARATSAASTFFESISIGPMQRVFIDGGTGANNPIHQLWIEAKRHFCPTEPLGPNLNCLISIGTGIPSLKNYGGSLKSMAKSIIGIVTETESTAF